MTERLYEPQLIGWHLYSHSPKRMVLKDALWQAVEIEQCKHPGDLIEAVRVRLGMKKVKRMDYPGESWHWACPLWLEQAIRDVLKGER